MYRHGASGGAGVGRVSVGARRAVRAAADAVDLQGQVVDLVPAAGRGGGAEPRGEVLLQPAPMHAVEVDGAAAVEQLDRVLDQRQPVQLEALTCEGVELRHVALLAVLGEVVAADLHELREPEVAGPE